MPFPIKHYRLSQKKKKKKKKHYRETLEDINEHCAIPEHRPLACFECEKIHSLSKLRLWRN